LKGKALEIQKELHEVIGSFERARYDSDTNPKPWQTFYFYLEGRAVPENLARCPVTKTTLKEIPHNGLHVCFSAIQPGSSLNPHTGPTNASLTAHLGLANCKDSILSVAGQKRKYQEGEVLIFDDSFIHSASNHGSRTRYTLMITFWHPELNSLEISVLKQAVRSIG
jgi:aspartyl/asparaginyl beta-hydroxylase (cupin superfamily)